MATRSGHSTLDKYEILCVNYNDVERDLIEDQLNNNLTLEEAINNMWDQYDMNGIGEDDDYHITLSERNK